MFLTESPLNLNEIRLVKRVEKLGKRLTEHFKNDQNDFEGDFNKQNR